MGCGYVVDAHGLLCFLRVVSAKVVCRSFNKTADATRVEPRAIDGDMVDWL